MEPWEESYARLMFGPNHTQDTMAAATEVKDQHMPKLLFKYRTVSDNKIDALRNDYLMSSPPHMLNDMFEGSLYINKDTAVKTAYQLCYDRLRMEFPELPAKSINIPMEIIEAFSNTYGIDMTAFRNDKPRYSLLKEMLAKSEEVTYSGIDDIQNTNRNLYNIISLSAVYDNKLMWAHYADEGRGFCVGYDIKSLGITNPLSQLTLPVLYKDNPSFEVQSIDELDGSQAMFALSCKSTDWKYEQEWRAFFVGSDCSRKENMPSPKVLYLGPRINSLNKHTLLEICSAKQIKVFEMQLNIKTNQLEPQEICTFAPENPNTFCDNPSRKTSMPDNEYSPSAEEVNAEIQKIASLLYRK